MCPAIYVRQLDPYRARLACACGLLVHRRATALSTDGANTEINRVFNAKRQLPAPSERLPQKYRVILDNPFFQFATLFAANSRNRAAGKVNPSDFSNPLNEH